MEHIRRTILIMMCAVLVLFHLPAIAETSNQSSSSNDESLEMTDAGSLTITGSKYVAKGKSVTLKASEAVTWSTSNKKTATVSAKGVVKGIKAGKVKITATSKSNPKVKKTWIMTVKDKAVSKVTIKAAKTELDPDETITLKATASPSEAAQSFEWKSSNSKVATVNEKGKVKAVSAGKAKITAAATDGSKKKATITITVKKTNPPQTGKKVGISMPTKDLRWWELAGESMTSQLTNNGFDVDTQYASNDIYNQVVQIESMIDNGADILVIAAIDPSSLGTVLDKAGDQGVKVIAYERLLLDSINVDYYVTFNYYMIGNLQGSYIKKALDLDHSEGPYNMEITAGDYGNDNAAFFYSGAIDVLKPYIDAGKIKVPSGQTEFSDVATSSWRTEAAQNRAEDILAAYYANGEKLDAWLCSNDSTALGVINALEAYYRGKEWPIITGQDCDLENVRKMIAGLQSMSVFRDIRVLVAQTVKMIGQISRGEDVDVNDTETYSNNAKIVPAFLCDAVVVDANNYKKYLIDSGWYTEADLK